MQCNDGKQSDKHLFCQVRSSPSWHLIPNTLQHSPGLHNETDNTQNTQHGIQWRFFSQLEDLDYAYDNCSIM